MMSNRAPHVSQEFIPRTIAVTTGDIFTCSYKNIVAYTIISDDGFLRKSYGGDSLRLFDMIGTIYVE